MLAELYKMWADTEARINRVERSYVVLGVAVVTCMIVSKLASEKQRVKIDELTKEIKALKGLEGE